MLFGVPAIPIIDHRQILNFLLSFVHFMICVTSGKLSGDSARTVLIQEQGNIV